MDNDRIRFPIPLELLGVALLFAWGLLIRALLWDTQGIVSVDGTAFIRMAWHMQGGAPLDSVHQYGYPALILAAHTLIPDWVTAARMVTFVFGMAAIPLTWAVAAAVVTRPWLRLVPVLGVATLPLPVRYSLTTMTEGVYVTLLLAMFALALHRRPWWAGLAAGLAYAVRPEAVLVAAGLAGFLILRERAWRPAAGLVAVGALVIGAYIVVQGVTLDKWTLTEKTINLGAGTWQAAEERVGERVLAPGLGDRLAVYGRETLASYPARFWGGLQELLRQTGWVAVVLAPFGVWGPALPVLAGLLPFLALHFTFVSVRARFYYSLQPFVWILAVAAIDRVPRAWMRYLLAGLVIAGMGASAFRDNTAYRLNEDGYFPELVEAGRYLERFVRPDDIVFDRKPYVAFYARGQLRYVPTGPYDEVIDHIVAEGGDYLVVNNFVARNWRPELLPLCTDPDFIRAEDRLVPVYHAISERGMRTLVYRIRSAGGPGPLPAEDRIEASLDHMRPGG